MIIDWQKYSEWMTPLRLRTQLLLELIRVLVWQIPRAQTSFTLWLETAKYKAALNASVVVLQQAIQREFGVYATITELDGKPADFLVSVDGNVDENRMKALIDGYKLAGKSYVFRLGAIAYSAKWANYRCEDIIDLYTAEWVSHACEDTGAVELLGYLIKDETDSWYVYVSSRTAVQSDIDIAGTIRGLVSNNWVIAGTFSGQMATGSSAVNLPVQMTQAATGYYIVEDAVLLTPAGDEYYSYTYKNAL